MLHPFCSDQKQRLGMRGFTLIEILVAISMLAIVMFSIYGVFGAVSATKQRLEGDSADYHLARVVYDRLGRELLGVFFRPNDSTTFFRGGTNNQGELYLELTTTATTPISGTGSGVAHVNYLLAEDDKTPGGHVLMRSEWQRQRLSAAADEHTMMRLAPGIAGLMWRFYAGGTWHEAWDSTRQGLPELVEVSMQLESDEREQLISFRTSYRLPVVVLP